MISSGRLWSAVIEHGLWVVTSDILWSAVVNCGGWVVRDDQIQDDQTSYILGTKYKMTKLPA